MIIVISLAGRKGWKGHHFGKEQCRISLDFSVEDGAFYGCNKQSTMEDLPESGELRESYEQAILQGKQLFGELASWRVRPSSTQLLNDLYYVQSGYVHVPKEIKEDLANWNVNVNSVQFVDVCTPSRRTWDAAYSYHISARTGLLLINQAFKDDDVNPPERRRKPSEIAWQSCSLEAERDSVRPSRIRCIVLYHIVNYNTKKVIYETIRRSTSTVEKPNGYKEYTDLDDGFYALLGSVLGKSIMHMLLDHKAEMGYRSIDRVVLLGKKGLDPAQQWELARSFLIVLSEPRSPKRASSDPPCSPDKSTKRRRLSNST